MNTETKREDELFAEAHGPANPRWRFWECVCGWRVTEVRYLGIVFDAPCPRCARKYSTFSRREMGGDSPNAKLTHVLRLTRRVTARTETLTALWCKRDFMEMGPRYREIRARLRKPMDTCHVCGHKIADGEMIAIACFAEGGNKVLCQPCADELLSSGGGGAEPGDENATQPGGTRSPSVGDQVPHRERA